MVVDYDGAVGDKYIWWHTDKGFFDGSDEAVATEECIFVACAGAFEFISHKHADEWQCTIRSLEDVYDRTSKAFKLCLVQYFSNTPHDSIVTPHT